MTSYPVGSVKQLVYSLLIKTIYDVLLSLWLPAASPVKVCECRQLQFFDKQLNTFVSKDYDGQYFNFAPKFLEMGNF